MNPKRSNLDRHGYHPRFLPCLVWICLAVAVLFGSGCQSHPLSEYISPRVTGRVLAADTRQPLAGAKVRRVVPDQNLDIDTPPKGGEVMQQTPAVRTDRDGKFVLDSERAIALIRHEGWWSVTLSFEHAGYASFQTNYTIASVSTNSPQGEPLVEAGDILLRPILK